MAVHSSILAWQIPWTEEPGRIQSIGLQRVMDMTEEIHFHFLIYLSGILLCPTS